MQKGRVLRLHAFGVVEFFQKNSFLLTIAAFFTIGVFVGIFAFDSFDYLKLYCEGYVVDFITARQSVGFLRIFISTLINALSGLFLLFIFGSSFFGVVLIPCGLMAFGCIRGGLAAYLYSTYGLKGVAFNAVVLIPVLVIYVIILLFAAKQAICFSLRLAGLTLNKATSFNISYDFREYTAKYVIYAAFCVLCAVTDAAVSIGLLKHFIL